MEFSSTEILVDTKKQRAYVISHFHWDREWYLPFQDYRALLVSVLDELLDLLEQDPGYRCFTLDGQTVPLEDYLAIRPEQRDRLLRQIKAGNIEIGPWFVQPDEFLLSGESLIRNLLLGFRQARAFGVEPMKVGYVPDCFGHISQLPQLFAGFGIGSAVLFRGLDSSQVKHEFTWQSPDGSQALGILMESEWAYSTLWYALRDYCEHALPYDRDDIVRRISNLRDKHAVRANTGVLLFMDGVDHAPAWQDLPRALRDANASIPDLELRKARLSEYIAAITDALAGTSMERVSGELRQTCHQGMSDVFMGTMVSRVHLKQANAYCERLLSLLCEPLAIITRRLGKEYPTRFLELAWHHLLLNHPHDSICGCSVDQVHRDMAYRFDQARLIGERQTMERLAHIAARVEAKETDKETAYLLFNPDTRPSPLVLRLTMPMDKEWQVGDFTLEAVDGRPLRFQVLDTVHDISLVKEHQATPLFLPETLFDVVIELAEPIPPMGYMTIVIRKSDPPTAHPEGSLPMLGVMENEFLRVDIHVDGSLAIFEKTTGRRHDQLLTFEDVGDIGDGWKCRFPPCGTVVSTRGTPADVRRLNAGPLATQYAIDHKMQAPESASKESGQRSAATGENTINNVITLLRGCPYLLVETTVGNNTRDHAVRAVFPTGLSAASVSAGDTPFDVVERPISLPDTTDWREPAYSSWPRQSFADISDGASGLAVLSEGLYEYDARDDQARTLSVMLLRGFANVIGRPHDEGGQELGEHHFRYAIFPHAGDWRTAMLPAVAQAFRSTPRSMRCFPPRRGKALPTPERTLPARQSFLTLQPESLALTALKKSEDTDGVIVRYYNPCDNPVDATIVWWSPIKEAYLTNLDERRETALPVNGQAVSIRTPPRKIITVELVECLHETANARIYQKEPR